MKKELGVLLCSVLVVGWTTITIMEAAAAHTPRQGSDAPRDTRPTIQVCDKPLWDRIKDGCNE